MHIPFEISFLELFMLMVLQAVLLYIGTGIFDFRDRSLGKSIWATLGIGVFAVLILAVDTYVKLGEAVVVVVTAVLAVFVIQNIFATSFMKALKALVFTVMMNAIAGGIMLTIIRRLELQ
ncbi:hypothetical protein GF339_06970 [candidate division KSB3 bacterium]|uniref:Uncharacterized protein n=1 Tax=candidate division KSB3 bacterium TaxID=2044937 RepID=A0A9D5JU66_9BACT|nr:hypothetical protein [candidate division KSB3 bacterium]MBD3324309.1 hypothetical protein [candidate division KSB3 bacterium]